ncbi:MAG TPA: hypothetical protein VG916_13040 [Gemmatimonadaceae bacterium]|nr:hypothetical protein [Gemmatimonadaceae bacterium]
MDSALYYTFSTVAQTLAAAIALLAGFALFRIQGLQKVMDDTSLDFIQAFEGADHGRLTSLHRASDFAGLVVAMKAMNIPHSLSAEPRVTSKRDFDVAFERSQRVRSRLNQAMAGSVVMILASIIALTRVPDLASNAFTQCALAAAWVGTAVCLILYWRVVSVALE